MPLKRAEKPQSLKSALKQQRGRIPEEKKAHEVEYLPAVQKSHEDETEKADTRRHLPEQIEALEKLRAERINPIPEPQPQLIQPILHVTQDIQGLNVLEFARADRNTKDSGGSDQQEDLTPDEEYLERSIEYLKAKLDSHEDETEKADARRRLPVQIEALEKLRAERTRVMVEPQSPQPEQQPVPRSLDKLNEKESQRLPVEDFTRAVKGTTDPRQLMMGLNVIEQIEEAFQQSIKRYLKDRHGIKAVGKVRLSIAVHEYDTDRYGKKKYGYVRATYDGHTVKLYDLTEEELRRESSPKESAQPALNG